MNTFCIFPLPSLHLYASPAVVLVAEGCSDLRVHINVHRVCHVLPAGGPLRLHMSRVARVGITSDVVNNEPLVLMCSYNYGRCVCCRTRSQFLFLPASTTDVINSVRYMKIQLLSVTKIL
jgi:hypothetical protein